jgi:uncharacterized Zn-finger protein
MMLSIESTNNSSNSFSIKRKLDHSSAEKEKKKKKKKHSKEKHKDKTLLTHWSLVEKSIINANNCSIPIKLWAATRTKINANNAINPAHNCLDPSEDVDYDFVYSPADLRLFSNNSNHLLNTKITLNHNNELEDNSNMNTNQHSESPSDSENSGDSPVKKRNKPGRKPRGLGGTAAKGKSTKPKSNQRAEVDNMFNTLIYKELEKLVGPYNCSHCIASFDLSESLRRHCSRVHAEKSYICEVCKKGFLDQTKLKRHSIIHTNLRPYVCTYPGCNKSFSLDFNLKTHQKLHTGEKPHLCTWPNCNKAFAQPSNLKTHYATHKNPNSRVNQEIKHKLALNKNKPANHNNNSEQSSSSQENSEEEEEEEEEEAEEPGEIIDNVNAAGSALQPL